MQHRQNQYLKAIHGFTSVLIQKRSINEIIWTIVQTSISSLKYHDCVIYLYNSETGKLDQMAAHGPKKGQGNEVINPITLSPGEGIVGSVFAKGKGEIIPNTLKDPRYIADDAIRLSEMTVPILYGDKVIGIIDCEHPDENFFTKLDFKIITSIAEIAATKITQAKADEALLLHQKQLEQKVEAKTKELNRRIQELQKANAELDQIAYIVAHDIKSPLKNISLLSEWIEEDLATIDTSNTELDENLSLLKSRVGRLDKIIKGVFDYSRVGVNKQELTKVILFDFVENLLKAMYIPKGVEVLNKSIPAFSYIDGVNMGRIIQNLVENAIKHSDKKNITILVEFKRENQDFTLIVKDNGPGIPQEYHQKVFEIFQTLKPKDTGENTGLGLAIIKKILDENDATVNLESDKGKGCTFTIKWHSKKTQPNITMV